MAHEKVRHVYGYTSENVSFYSTSGARLVRMANPSPVPDPLNTTSDEPRGGGGLIKFALPLVLLASTNEGGRALNDVVAHDGLEG